MIARRRPAAQTPDPFSYFAKPAVGTPQSGAPSVEDLFRRNLTPEPSPAARLSEMLRQDYAPAEPAVPDYPPIRGFSYKIPISPQQQEARRGPGTASGGFGYDQIEQGAEDFLKQLQQRALQQAFKERGIHFDPVTGVRSTGRDGALPKPPGSVLRQGPTYSTVRDKLGPLGKSNAGDIGLGDVAPVTGSLLALDDIAAMRAREAAGLDVGGVEKATTYLGALPIPGARPVSKAGRELVDRIARKIGGEPGAALRDKLIKDGLPAAENAAEGKAAVATALSDKSYVAAAMYRPDLGEITISNGVAGDPARSYQGGYGLSHIIERRKLIGEDGEAIVRDIVPDVLANGRVIEQPQNKVGPPRIAVVDKGHKVFLEQRWVGGRRSWVVSDFSSRNEGGVLPRLPLRGRSDSFDTSSSFRKKEWHEANLAAGSKDPVTGALVMQPSKDRLLLLKEAERARPEFEASLQGIADAIPGAFVEGPRIKANNQRLTQKIQRYRRDLKRSGKAATGPDDGAHLIDDYVAGRLVVDNQEALDNIVKVVESRFEVVRKFDRMKEPIRSTGFSGLYYQVRLPNGMSAELQIQPKVFWEASRQQRAIYEKLREFEGRRFSNEDRRINAELQSKSKQIFGQAWNDWIQAGGRDVRRSNRRNRRRPR